MGERFEKIKRGARKASRVGGLLVAGGLLGVAADRGLERRGGLEGATISAASSAISGAFNGLANSISFVDETLDSDPNN